MEVTLCSPSDHDDISNANDKSLEQTQSVEKIVVLPSVSSDPFLQDNQRALLLKRARGLSICISERKHHY